jgi:hypothetical protein
MDNIIRKDSLFKMFKEYCFNIAFKNEIFTRDNNGMSSNILYNNKPLDQMNDNDKELILKSLENINLYNKDFSLLCVEYLVKKPNPNYDEFKEFIYENCNGFYYKKAIILFIIRFLFLIVEFIILYFLIYPEFICVDKPIDDNDKMFWINKNEKYKVIKKKIINIEWFLKMVSTLIDLIFIFCEFIVLSKIQRIKGNVYLVVFAQIFKYFSDILVIVLDSTKEICEKSKNEDNIFYKKKKVLDLDIFLIFYYIIKYFIN